MYEIDKQQGYIVHSTGNYSHYLVVTYNREQSIKILNCCLTHLKLVLEINYSIQNGSEENNPRKKINSGIHSILWKWMMQEIQINTQTTFFKTSSTEWVNEL